MDKNCLVVKNKEGVSPDLPFFNCIRLYIKCTVENQDYVRFSMVTIQNPLTIKIIDSTGNVYLSDETASNNYGNEHTYAANTYPFLRGSGITDWVEVLITPVSSFRGFGNYTYNDRVLKLYVEDLAYNENLLSLIMKTADVIVGDITALSTSSITSLKFKADVDCVDVAKITSLTSLELNIGGVYGSMSSLGALTNLAFLRIDNNGIYGDIKDYVEARRAAGQTTSESFTNGVDCACKVGIKFNNTTISERDAFKLSWDSSSIIYKRSSIHKAYVYNITQAQRDALVSDGYTSIIDVL